MTPAERRQLVERLLPHTDAQAARVSAMFGFLRHLDQDDLRGQARLELLAAVDRYDPERASSNEPAGFVLLTVRNRLVDYVRRQHGRTLPGRKSNPRRVPDSLIVHFDEPATSDADSELWSARAREYEPGYAKVEDKLMLDAVRRAAERVIPKQRDRQVILSQADPDVSLAELGRRFGVSESRMCQVRAKWNPVVARQLAK